VRGQAASSHHGASRGHRRVREGLPVLRRRSTIVEEPPTTVTDEPQCLLCFLIPSGTSYKNSTKVRVLTAKSVTQMNSAIRTDL
jgi:hypothetical protein